MHPHKCMSSICYLLFVAFIFISILTVLPDRDYIGNFTSAELKLEEKTDNKLTTYTYVDASGKTVSIEININATKSSNKYL